MIQKTFDLLGQIDLGGPAEPIAMLDGDALEVNIIRDGQRNTMLNLTHFDIDGDGARVSVEPIGIQIIIKRAGESGEVEKRSTKLRKPRAARAAKK